MTKTLTLAASSAALLAGLVVAPAFARTIHIPEVLRADDPAILERVDPFDQDRCQRFMLEMDGRKPRKMWYCPEAEAKVVLLPQPLYDRGEGSERDSGISGGGTPAAGGDAPSTAGGGISSTTSGGEPPATNDQIR
jgi:hypothetical protein